MPSPPIDHATFTREQLGPLAAVASLLTDDAEAAEWLVVGTLAAAHADWPQLSRSGDPLTQVRRRLTQRYLRSHRPQASTRGAGHGDLAVEPLQLADQVYRRPQPASPMEQCWQAYVDLPPRLRAMLVWSHVAGLDDQQTGDVVGPAFRRTADWVARSRDRALDQIAATLGVPVGLPGALPPEQSPGSPVDQLVGACLLSRQGHGEGPDLDRAAASIERATHDVEPRADPTRRRRWTVSLATAAALVLVGYAGVQLLSDDESSTPTVAATTSLPTAPAPGGFQLVGFRDIAAAVPVGWQVAEASCAIPFDGSFSYRAGPRVDGCDAGGVQPSITFSTISTYLPVLQEQPPEVARVADVRVFALPDKVYPGVIERTLLLPAAGLEVVVRAPDTPMLDTLVGSVQAIPEGFTAVPLCEGRPVGDALSELGDAGLAYTIDRASGASQRLGGPPVTFQNVAAGRLVPPGTEVLVRIPSF